MGVMLDDTFRLQPMIWCPTCERYIWDMPSHDLKDCGPCDLKDCEPCETP